MVNAYLVAFGAVLLLAGRLGDRPGRKRVFVAGLVIAALALAATLPRAAATPGVARPGATGSGGDHRGAGGGPD